METVYYGDPFELFLDEGFPRGRLARWRSEFHPGQGSVIGKVITGSRDLAGFHFTGSTSTFNTLWRQIGENLGHYKSYPKIVGETGGKNFYLRSSFPLRRWMWLPLSYVGAFEYQGQKCSAGSRAYYPGFSLERGERLRGTIC
mgnify:CR=1 FL=1